MQTLQLPDSKNAIRKFVNIDEERFIGVAKRCLWFKYEGSVLQRRISKLQFDYNAEISELYVGTESNVRCIDLLTGKITRVLANIVEDSDAEINIMKLNYDQKSLLIGTSQGEISTFSCADGRLIESIPKAHASDISGIE